MPKNQSSSDSNTEIVPARSGKPYRNSGLIGRVNLPSLPARNREGVYFLAELLNPLGAVKDLLSDFLYYKHQIKMLEVEQQRIIQEAGIRHHQIDAALKIAVTVLDDRRDALEKSFTVFSQELQSKRIERAKIIQSRNDN